MKPGTVDGLFWSGGLPTPEVTDLTTSLVPRHPGAEQALGG
ncbi:hypothetical protein [Saccharopolyspora elongata]|nr:hypothetical protein [Saccharopolyspora elongata]